MNSELQGLSPILWVKNLDETISFYVNVLGFKMQTNFPNFASLHRGDVQIMVILPVDEPEDCKDENNKEPFFPKSVLTGSIYIFVKNINAFWEEIKDKVSILSTIADREYLMRDFSIRDNNGYELVFGEDISKK